MPNTPRPAADGPQGRIPFVEFVAMMAGMMSINALSIDPMLPALPQIGEALDIADANDRQLIITSYFLGTGIGALFYGPLTDRFGRRPVIQACLALMLVATLFCALAQSFTMLLVARGAAGFLAAAMRVVSTSIIRDRFAGDQMARVMSLVFMAFVIVPTVAPGIGQIVLHFASWRWIFGVLMILGTALLLWISLRLPETLRPENRVEINVPQLAGTIRRVVTHRQAFAYMVATGILMSTLVTFIATIQQIIFDVFDAADLFPYLFAAIAASMAVGGFANQKLVTRFGARRLSQTALIALILVSLGHIAIVLTGLESLASFCIAQTLTLLCFAFVTSNFNSISMEPFAKGAGMAASFQAFLTTVISAVLGWLVGSQFDGTTLPTALGVVGFGVAGLAIVAWAEKGRLFTRPHHARLRDPASPPPV